MLRYALLSVLIYSTQFLLTMKVQDNNVDHKGELKKRHQQLFSKNLHCLDLENIRRGKISQKLAEEKKISLPKNCSII